MPNSNKALEIRADASKEFLRQADGLNLDLACFPSQVRATDTDFHDQRFAPLAKEGPLDATQLKKFLRDAQRRSEPARNEYIIDGEKLIVTRRADGTFEAKRNGKTFIAETAEACAVLASRDSAIREPNEEAKLRISRAVSTALNNAPQVAQRLFVAGVQEFCRASGGPYEEETLAQLKWLPLVNKAVAFCWQVMRPDFVPGQDWPDFLEKFAAGRPYSIAVLDAARNAHVLKTMDDLPVELPEPPLSPEAIEVMSDGDVSELMRDVRQEAVRQTRRRW